MAKRIVLSLDGTWNEKGQTDQGVEVETNVLKLHNALAGSAEQIGCYLPGVGTSPFQRVSGGAFGWGLFNQVKDGYRALIENYNPGDDIFIFGFSRGAYSARSLAGMILSCGVLRKDIGRDKLALDAGLGDLFTTTQDPNFIPDATDKVFALYKHGYDQHNRAAIDSFRQRNCHAPKIRFIGVWDTVGALGLPDKLIIPVLRGIDAHLRDRWFGFLNTALHPSIDAACHALAIDERREPFLPSLWTDPPDKPPRINVPGSNIKQVWFAGSHSNVGGGYLDTGLSDIALKWMATHAVSQGLAVDPARIADIDANPLGLRRDSLSEFVQPFGSNNPTKIDLASVASSLRSAVQEFAESRLEIDRPIVDGSVIHASVNTRLQALSPREPTGSSLYQPPTTLQVDITGGMRRVHPTHYRLDEP